MTTARSCMINSSITHAPDGTHTAKFPWKEEHPSLPSSCLRKENALHGSSLQQTPRLLKAYGDIGTDQEKRGFIENVHEANLSSLVHYKKESSTTPIRIVYYCSCCQSPEKPCLIACFTAAPPFHNDMCFILIRFRTFQG